MDSWHDLLVKVCISIGLGVLWFGLGDPKPDAYNFIRNPLFTGAALLAGVDLLLELFDLEEELFFAGVEEPLAFLSFLVDVVVAGELLQFGVFVSLLEALGIGDVYQHAALLFEHKQPEAVVLRLVCEEVGQVALLLGPGRPQSRLHPSHHELALVGQQTLRPIGQLRQETLRLLVQDVLVGLAALLALLSAQSRALAQQF